MASGGGEGTGYMSEPLTHGKVVIHTTLGPIDVELWSNQAPMACRNFVQLCLEGYYDGCQFFRVLKNFIAQTGDPTNTGQGGESSFGGTFKDEFHSRLRFNRRGLVAMAGEGDVPNSNKSQFFFTLAPTEALQKRHTLFGKITGDTLYNLLKVNDLELDADDRPYSCPRITSTEVLLNPFNDIQIRAKKVEVKQKKKKKKLKKKSSLLSFDDDEVGLESTPLDKQMQKKSKSSHDLLQDDTTLSSKPAPLKDNITQRQTIGEDQSEDDKNENSVQQNTFKMAASSAGADSASAVRAKLKLSGAGVGDATQRIKDKLEKAKAERETTKRGEAALLAKEIRGLDARAEERKLVRASEEKKLETRRKKGKRAFGRADYEKDDLLSVVEQNRRVFKQRKKRTKDREGDTLAKLASFSKKIQSAPEKAKKAKESPASDDGVAEKYLDEEDLAVQRDLETGGWLAHKVKFGRRPQDFDHMARDQDKYEYSIFDPRDTKGLKHNLPPRENDRKRKRDQARRSGGRGTKKAW